jgi:hypothetical protein
VKIHLFIVRAVRPQNSSTHNIGCDSVRAHDEQFRIGRLRAPVSRRGWWLVYVRTGGTYSTKKQAVGETLSGCLSPSKVAKCPERERLWAAYDVALNVLSATASALSDAVHTGQFSAALAVTQDARSSPSEFYFWVAAPLPMFLYHLATKVVTTPAARGSAIRFPEDPKLNPPNWIRAKSKTRRA